MPASEARVSIADAGFLHGFGFFETFRTSGGHPHHWAFNQRRLAASCARAGLRLPDHFLAADSPRLRAIVRALLDSAGVHDAVFRYTVTAGHDETPSELLACRELPSAAPTGGVALRVLGLTRDSGEWLPRPKSVSYLNAVAGAREVDQRRKHESDEGLFLSRGEGFVVETPRQNIAWISGGRICYPDPVVGGIAGTCLSWLLELGPACAPCKASVTELVGAEAIFVLNAVRGITPIREIYDPNDLPLRCGIESASHPLVMMLKERWADELRATAERLAG